MQALTPPSMKAFFIGKFIVYEKARESHRLICNLIRSNQLDYSMRDQLKRASSSIVLNIAEGNGRRSDGERKRFFAIARGSAEECRAILDLLEDEMILTTGQTASYRSGLHEVVKMLTALIYRT